MVLLGVDHDEQRCTSNLVLVFRRKVRLEQLKLFNNPVNSYLVNLLRFGVLDEDLAEDGLDTILRREQFELVRYYVTCSRVFLAVPADYEAELRRSRLFVFSGPTRYLSLSLTERV